MDVTLVARRQTPLIGSLTLSGPIVCLRRRGFNRSGGGIRLRTYKEVFGKTRLPPRDSAASLAVCANNVNRHRARESKRSVGVSEEEQSKAVRNHCLVRVPSRPSPSPPSNSKSVPLHLLKINLEKNKTKPNKKTQWNHVNQMLF